MPEIPNAGGGGGVRKLRIAHWVCRGQRKMKRSEERVAGG